jgi:glycosyltransferase involved in cell wall biosynthesis
MALAYPLSGQPTFMHNNGFNVLMVSANGKELPLLLNNENCPHLVVPMTRKITPLQDLKCIITLVKIFRKEKPAIVHTETPKAGLLGMVAAKIAGIKIRIHTVAGLPMMVEKGFKLQLLKIIEKITYAASTNIWPNSNSLKNYILKNNFTSINKIHVIGGGSSNGINTYRYNRSNIDTIILNQIKKNINYSDKNFYLLFIGRLVLDKGITELVEAFLILQKTQPNLILLLVGQYEADLDPLPAHVESEIKNNTNIIHINWTNQVEYYFFLANLFVFPSYREGFPNVLLEAASMKLPIVCSEIAGNVDIVSNNETGLIFESMSKEDLLIKLQYAISNNSKMQLMADKLFNIITSTYEREIFWESMKKQYDILLKK